jgi:hypothetical protein
VISGTTKIVYVRKHHPFLTVGTDSKIQLKIVERVQMDISRTQIHHRWISCFGTYTAIKCGGFKLISVDKSYIWTSLNQRHNYLLKMKHSLQELLTLLEHLSSPQVFSRVCVTQSLVLCVMFCRSLFVLFFAMVLSVLLRFTLFFQKC